MFLVALGGTVGTHSAAQYYYLFLDENICCGYSRGASNEYQIFVFIEK